MNAIAVSFTSGAGRSGRSALASKATLSSANTFAAAQTMNVATAQGIFAAGTSPPTHRRAASRCASPRAPTRPGRVRHQRELRRLRPQRRITGDFSTGVSPVPVDPGYAWAFDLFGHTGNGVVDGNGLSVLSA